MMDTLTIVPEIGVPFVPGTCPVDLLQRAEAACNTALALEPYGLDVEPNDDDRYLAKTLTQSYAADPETTSRKVTDTRLATIHPACLVLAGKLLGEYGRVVVNDSLQIRHMVTNRLILESDHEDARIRLRALELLGKISDVGLFTEKKEVTISHTTTEELRAKLKTKLHGLIRPGEVAAVAEYEVLPADNEELPEIEDILELEDDIF